MSSLRYDFSLLCH